MVHSDTNRTSKAAENQKPSRHTGGFAPWASKSLITPLFL